MFSRSESARLLQALAAATRLLRVTTAYLTVYGYEILARRLTNSVIRLIVGSPDACNNIREVLDLFRKTIENGPPSDQKRAIVRAFHEELVRGSARVRAFDPRFIDRVHAKVYIFDNHAAYITSVNLTHSGLWLNIEAGHVVRDPSDVAFYIRCFDEFFETADELLTELLQRIENSWAFAPEADPYLLYLRVLLELFSDVPDLDASTTYRLADYQRMIVGSVLHVLREQRGALLVAPTGTGKTVMAAYIAASLFPSVVRRIFVLCPNPSLKAMWEAVFLRFRVPPQVITHGILQEKGKRTRESEKRLSDLLGTLDARDLVIVDESHVFRNQDSIGFRNVAKFLSTSGAKARRLLLTATPMSTGIENFNAQLELVSDERLQDVSDVAKARSIVNVTLPFIINHFGMEDSGTGTRRALRFGKQLRSFPKIVMKTIAYTSPMASVFESIRKMQLRFRRPTKDSGQLAFSGFDIEGRADGISMSVFHRLILMQRAESSPAALTSTIDAMLAREYEESFEPVDPERFRSELLELRDDVCDARTDTKLYALVDLLKQRPPEDRVLLFSSHVATVEYLLTELKKQLPHRRIDSVTGSQSTRERKEKLKRFAPGAQGKPRRNRKDDIDILVASDAIAEGENSQDAVLLANYDLHWTPLKLIQRVGRVDRPTRNYRQVDVWNFYPNGTIFDEMLKLWSRLGDRSGLYSAMARTNVVGEHERDLGRYEDRDVGFVRALYEEEDYESLLSEYIPTSQHLVDRAKATPEEVRAAHALPLGSRSARKASPRGTFALLRSSDSLHCVFREGERQTSSPEQVAHEALVPRAAAERGAAALPLPSTSDRILSQIVEEWAQSHRCDADDVTVVCASESVD